MIMPGDDTIMMKLVDRFNVTLGHYMMSVSLTTMVFYDTVANDLYDVDYYAPMIFFLTAHCTDNSVTTFIQ